MSDAECCWWCHDEEWEQVIDGRRTCDRCRYLAARAAIRTGIFERTPHLKAVSHMEGIS